jgi:hypothetical protein
MTVAAVAAVAVDVVDTGATQIVDAESLKK